MHTEDWTTAYWLQAWKGYKQSLNVTQSGLTVSMDAAVTAMTITDPIAWVQQQLGK
jgi:hypothetical protein